MKERAGFTPEEFSVLIASEQTAGRGRLGRSFHSPKDTGVYMSILFKIKEEQNPLLITTDAAVCAVRVFEKMTGEQAKIKWVNDIYMNGRKVCGILTEGIGEYAVLGIGINILPPKKGFPDDIKDRAGVVFKKREKYLRERVIVEFLREFMSIYQNHDYKKILFEYKEHSMLIGSRILILQNGTEETATALGIGDDYSLIVKKDTGEICNLNSGDVSIKI